MQIEGREREELCRGFPRPAGLELDQEGPTASTQVTAGTPEPPILFVCEGPVGAENPTREVPGSSAAGGSLIISLLLIALNWLHPPTGITVEGSEESDGPGSAPSTSGPATSPNEHENGSFPADEDQPGPSRRHTPSQKRGTL